MRPFLKWAGGKRQLIPEIEKQIPRSFGAYHEPFLGSGALFIHLRGHGRLVKACLADVNSELINAWLQIQCHVHPLIEALEVLACRTTREDYYAIRALEPTQLLPVDRAARFIYLNRTCFNGLHRENSKGGFNVPYGRYSNPRILDRENLMALSEGLAGIRLARRSFDAIEAAEGDFVYFDPPYDPISRSASFSAYSKGGFGPDDQARLARLFFSLAERGVQVLLSNSDTPLVRRLYGGAAIRKVLVRRSINADSTKRGVIHEVLISPKAPRR